MPGVLNAGLANVVGKSFLPLLVFFTNALRIAAYRLDISLSVFTFLFLPSLSLSLLALLLR